MATPGPKPKTPPEDVLDVFCGREDSSEPLTAPEIAGTLDCSRRTALDRLHELEARGAIASKKVGGRSRVWWLPNDAESRVDLPENDPLFSGEPLLAPEDPVDETEIDDVLYGEG